MINYFIRYYTKLYNVKRYKSHGVLFGNYINGKIIENPKKKEIKNN